jgi:NADH dehydrogenase FAD-containing subunit
MVKPYPPTAQHAIKQGKIAAQNIIFEIKGIKNNKMLMSFVNTTFNSSITIRMEMF